MAKLSSILDNSLSPLCNSKDPGTLDVRPAVSFIHYLYSFLQQTYPVKECRIIFPMQSMLFWLQKYVCSITNLLPMWNLYNFYLVCSVWELKRNRRNNMSLESESQSSLEKIQTLVIEWRYFEKSIVKPAVQDSVFSSCCESNYSDTFHMF